MTTVSMMTRPKSMLLSRPASTSTTVETCPFTTTISPIPSYLDTYKKGCCPAATGTNSTSATSSKCSLASTYTKATAANYTTTSSKSLNAPRAALQSLATLQAYDIQTIHSLLKTENTDFLQVVDLKDHRRRRKNTSGESPVRRRGGEPEYVVVVEGRDKDHIWEIAERLRAFYTLIATVQNHPTSAQPNLESDDDWIMVEVPQGHICIHLVTKHARTNFSLENLWRKDLGDDDDDESDEE